MRPYLKLLAVSWGLLGAAMLIDGVLEVISWSRDSDLSGSSLRWWHSTYMLPGVLAILLAVMIRTGSALTRPVGLFTSFVFALYVIYLMLITPQTLLIRPVLVLQLFVLALSLATITELLIRSKH